MQIFRLRCKSASSEFCIASGRLAFTTLFFLIEGGLSGEWITSRLMPLFFSAVDGRCPFLLSRIAKCRPMMLLLLPWRRGCLLAVVDPLDFGAMLCLCTYIHFYASDWLRPSASVRPSRTNPAIVFASRFLLPQQPARKHQLSDLYVLSIILRKPRLLLKHDFSVSFNGAGLLAIEVFTTIVIGGHIHPSSGRATLTPCPVVGDSPGQ